MKEFAEMIVESRSNTDSWDHFGPAKTGLRVIAPGNQPRRGGNGWAVVAQDAEFAAGGGADCWLIDSGDLALVSVDEIARSGLPMVLVAGAAAAIEPEWLDRADGFVLPGDDDDVVAAVMAGAAVPDRGLVVADFSDGAARTINALSMDASRIAAQLALLASERMDPAPVRGIDAGLVRRMIKLRRDRDRHFPAEIFADPAWDMLLDLMAARLEGKRVPVSSLCIAAAVPTTTALRWVRSLTEAGLIERRTDPTDARRSHVELSEASVAAMMAYLRGFVAVFGGR